MALFDDSEHFCQLFEESDAKIFEYVNDLSDYWTKGYGNSINYQIACPLLKDIFRDLETENGKASLRFAHAETILPLTSLLGLYKDDFVLRWNSSADEIENRKWRTSQISPFAANYAFVLINCSNSQKVSLFHNEKQVHIPGCSELYCDIQELREIWKDSLDCDFNSLCGISETQNCPQTSNKSEVAPYFFVGIALLCSLIILGVGLALYRKKSSGSQSTTYEALALN